MKRAAFFTVLLFAAACSRSEAESPPPKKDAPAPAPQKSAAAKAAPDGEKLYLQNCATCHMKSGGGVPYMQPDIRHSAWISNPDPQPLLSLILRGAEVMGEAANAYDNKMPPFEHLSDVEIAVLATRVRERFPKPPLEKPVTPGEVAQARKRPGLPWGPK